MLGFSQLSRVFLWFFLLCVLSIGCFKGKGNVTFQNKTGETIVEGQLKVGQQTFDLLGVKPSESRDFSFQSSQCHPCGYLVGVTLASGRRMVETIGTLREGVDYQDTLNLGVDRLFLESAQNESGQTGYLSKFSQEKKFKWVLP